MKKIKKQLLILLSAAVIIGGGLSNIPNPNNLSNHGENPIGASVSGEKEDNSQDNDGKNIGTDKQDCDKEEEKLSE